VGLRCTLEARQLCVVSDLRTRRVLIVQTELRARAGARVCGSTDLQSQHGVRDGGDADRASDDRVSPAVHHPLVGVRPGAVVEGRREVVAHQLRCVVVRSARTAQQARLGRIRRRQVHQGQRET